MNDPGDESLKPPLPGSPQFRRRPIRISDETLINSYLARPDRNLPLVNEATVEGVVLPTWASKHRQTIEQNLARHGALLLRGFRPMAPPEFEELIHAVSGNLLEYAYRSTPRAVVSGRIYTSTEYPSDQTIPLHNEMSYSSKWPMKIFFLCIQAAEEGGETPIADSRRVFNRIDPRIREKFIAKGVMYVRNYGKQLDLPWQEVFQTSDTAEVEQRCRALGISYEWKGGGGLCTRQVCQAVVRHPQTGEWSWFNQAHLFHRMTLMPEVRASLLTMLEPEDFPRNAYYGDGSSIEPAVLTEILKAYEEEQSLFKWNKGDVLILDNLLAAHGRRPFVGPRKIVVGMSEAIRLAASETE